MHSAFKYPNARREEDVHDIFFNKQVNQVFYLKFQLTSREFQIKDPFRYLENPDSKETIKFVDEQNDLTLPLLRDGDSWNQINKKLTKLWNFPKYTCASKRGSKYFYSHNR